MRPVTVAILGAVAVVTAGAAVLSWHPGNTTIKVEGRGEPVLPGMVEKANEISRIAVAEGDRSIAIHKGEKVWEIEGVGYPVEAGRFQNNMVGLLRMARLEPKTAVAAKYPLLELGAPGKPDTKGREFTLYDGKGGELARIRLGKKAPGRGDKGADGEYVLVGKDPQSWLVNGFVGAGAAITDWVDPEIVAINVNTVDRAVITRADGERLELYRNGITEQNTPKFEIAGGVPEGKKVKVDIAVRYAATDLANLELVDVRRAKPGGKHLSDAELTMSTGLKVDYSLDEDDTGNWVTVKVADPGKDEKLAQHITETTAGWQYRLKDYKVGQLEKRLADLIEDAN